MVYILKVFHQGELIKIFHSDDMDLIDLHIEGLDPEDYELTTE